MKRFFVLIFLVASGQLLSFNGTVDTPPDSVPFVVVLDAGHGGHDPGNLGNGFMEKNIALSIVLEVGKWLEKQPDIKVIYTRNDDSFIDLYLRGKIANDANADLFVSVHCDSHSSDAHGAGTFVLGLHANEQNFEIAKKENSVIYLEDNYESRYAEYDINSPESIIGLTIMQEEFLDQSIMLAKLMQDEFSGKLKRNDRKVKQAGFIVLHQTFMPSVLVETGFLTNKNEGSYLNSSRGQLELGRAIADAILVYKQNVRSQPGNLIASSAPPTAIPDKRVAVRETPREKLPEPTAIQAKPEPPVKEEIQGKVQDMAITEVEIKTPQTVTDNKPASPLVIPSEEKVAEELAIADEVKEVSQPAASAPKVEEPVNAPEKEEAGAVEFKVQLMASSRDLPLRPDDFNGLGRLSKEPYNNLYRYFYGSTASFDEAKMLKANADMKGYTTSFIVAYKDGVRISIKEAMKYVKE
jgi:N-acetylmuramoyl-L-alanine amidase